MKKILTLITTLVFVSVVARAAEPSKPNIVYILTDDLGYGDVHCLNPERGKLATPNLDRLAADGMTFTDAHSSSSVCTPTRYSILTGRYAWRTHLQRGVLSGNSAPLIAPQRLTVGKLLQQHGYTTAAIGKWHLGMEFDQKDFSQPITDGPLQHGFDYYFGISASLDMPPYVFIENDRFTKIPSVTKEFPSLMYGKPAKRGPVRKGPAAPDFEAIDAVPKLTEKAVAYIDGRRSDKKPFFLYLALPSPHTPLVPAKEWQGKSGFGPYGDYVMETDWAVGEVLQAIDRAGQRENTLVILTSDNGCATYIGVKELEALGHYPSAQFRGYKTQIWEGGHRIPFLARWPAKIKAGSQSDQVTCLTDLMATCADIVGAKLPDTAGEDSVSILPVLLGTARSPLREAVVHHSYHGAFAIRQGDWKLELCQGSGGATTGETGDKSTVQLYDVGKDIAETNNLSASHPEIVARLTKLLEQYVADGRSTPGAKQANDASIQIRKQPAGKQAKGEADE